MVRSKKKNYAPNPMAVVLMRALKRNKLVETPQPCPENSLPESVKNKAVSSKLQKELSKKRKRVDKLMTKKQEGLKLLKRGSVTMHRIIRRKILGIKHLVPFNKKGEPYGPSAAEMQSYIGVLARTKPPIWYGSWNKVPKESKNKIWECVQMAYDVPPSARKMVLKSACQKWREFKSRLTTHYVLPYSHQPELLESPPADYSFIEKAHWDIHVVDRTSNEFLAIHEKQKKRRELNLYPHRISRKGYANLEQELSQGDSEMEIDRSTSWSCARKDKNGNFIDAVKKIVLEIEKMKQRVSDGEVTEEGIDDVLTKVLDTPEHRGRVRGQGTQVKQSVYFNLPRQKRGKSIDDKIQVGIQKFMAEETSRIIRERDAFWAAEMEKLKGALCGKNISFDASPVIDSQQGSCSKGKDLELIGSAKKKLKVDGDKIEEVQEEEKHVEKMTEVEEKNEVEEKDQVEEKIQEVEEKDQVEEKNQEVEEVVEVEDEQLEVENVCEDAEVNVLGKEDKLPVGRCLEWEFAVGSPVNVVTYATIDTVTDVLHGKPLEKENARVSVTRVIQGDAMIPFPVEDEIMTVQQSFGTYIAWPRDLILEKKAPVLVNPPSKASKTKNAGKKYKKMNDLISKPEYVVEIGADYLPSLKRLWIWANDVLKDGRTTSFPLCEEAFGSTRQ